MAHEAMIAGRNAALTATLDTAGWTAEAPVALTLNPDGVRAWSTAPGGDDAPVVLGGVFPVAEVLSFAALFGTNLYQADETELVLYADADRTVEAWTSGRVPVLPPMLDTDSLAFEDPRKFDGRLDPDDYLAYPANVLAFPPAIYARGWRWRIWSAGILPSGATAGHVEVDHLWLGDGLFFDLQLDTDVLDNTGVTTRQDAGREIVEPGEAQRTATLPLDLIEPGMVDQVVAMVRRSKGLMPLAWLPDRDDPALSFQYGFLARATQAGRRWSASSWASTSLTLQEWK